ncbi:mediator complex, subunit Med5 [Apodospora peruviana]|uniref:Mediator of RNA polymerase II transcription subunit 5 n=1 Tax=Apodospora peruviana TaxID=516989 RepID=A0AAE0IJ22_9PEZI|nr:mediator complex, subunit Med5 [Apodospora peruviana]
MAPSPATTAGRGLPAAVAEWTRFLKLAEAKRLDPDSFASYVPMLYSKHRLPAAVIADLLLRPTKSNQNSLDPRFSQYLQALLRLQIVDTAAVLKGLYKYSTLHKQLKAGTNEEQQGGQEAALQKQQKLVRWRSSSSSEEMIFWRLVKQVSQTTAGIKNGADAIAVVKVTTKWMGLFTDAATAFSRDAFGAVHSLAAKEEMESSRGAFLLLLLAVCENPVVLSTLSRDVAKESREQLCDNLEGFIPTIIQTSHEIASRLDLFRTETLASFEPVTDKKDTAISEMNSYMDNLIGLERFQVPEIPVVNSRAGLYIYLNAALVGRPLIDDSALFTYFHNRYQGDIQMTAIQLILASFDVLANAVFHNEGSKIGHLLKSYVVNKVPLILSQFAASSAMYPFDAEYCITQALGQVDINVFPTLSGMFDMPTNSSFQDSVRQDFCFACQLHGLLSQTAIENLLGDITYQSLPDEGRYVKETLVQSCLEDPERTQKLIGELDNMNGNVGAAAQAIIEVIGTLCRNKETMTLKQLCSQLASRPLSLDILLLFDKPYKILHPLCELLDNWGGHDEDQGEYQPVYEEFGSILLLLMAFVYRYSLSPAELGIRSPDSFIGKLLSGGNTSRPLDELTEQEKSHMNGWIHGLFDTEAGGLGDELMSSCPPQDFYLLMPTLFHQIVLALSTGHLTEDMLKTGLEYLVDISLLPALVPAILYLANQLWADRPQSQGATIRVLQLILRPNSISNEASTMLSSVLNIVAKPLEHSLRSYQRQDPKSQEVEPLLRSLKENLPLSRRTGGADHNELEAWTGTHVTGANGGPTAQGANHAGGGLSGSIRTTVTNLAQWAQQPASIGLPAYTHRQILVAVKMLGAKHLLSILLEELKNQTALGNDSVAYDVVTAIICAPDISDKEFSLATMAAPDDTAAQQHLQQLQRHMTVRQALKAEADDWKRIQRADPAMAETVVRLYRRVEAQMAPLPPPPAAAAMLSSAELDSALGVGVGSGDAALDDAMMAAAAAAGVENGQLHHHDPMSLDTSAVDLGDLSGLGGSATNSAGPNTGGMDLSSATTDDIFGGLQMQGGVDFSKELEFGAWDMDLT